jgi:hypothetical protein
MNAGTKLSRLVGIYVFAAIIGVLGGRIFTAAHLYSELGWTAMWVEIGSWGTDVQSEPVQGNSTDSVHTSDSA